jgi:sarcosine oxidase, subunit alpha
MRVWDHPVLGPLSDAQPVSFSFDGQEITGRTGDTIASALMAHGIRVLRHSDRLGEPRGIYCGIGHCFECRVTVNGTTGVRACITPISEGIEVCSGHPIEPDREGTDREG